MKSTFISSILFLFPYLLLAQTTEKSLFWEISGNGLKDTSYLYGTMHAKDKRVFDFKEGVLNSFDKCDIYAMELNPDSVNQMAIMNLMWMKGDVSIKELLSKKEYNFLDQYFKDSIGQPIFLFNRMLPIMTSQLILSQDLKEDMELALDMHFAALAKDQNKQVVGLEKMEEQIAALDGIPYKFQAKMLYESVLDKSKGVKDNTMEDMMSAYVEGDLEQLLLITNEENMEDEKMQELFNQLMLLNRNKVMVERAVPLIENSSAFIAVGAAHLGGKDGVIQLLRNRGYSVVAR